MGLAVVPTDWTAGYTELCVRWPDSPEWRAILRGLLTAPYETEFWDKFTGDPTDAQDTVEETFNQNLSLEECMVIPVGTILEYAGLTEPTGYLFCHGQAVSRATYAALFAVIGTVFGVGDGTTTFNLPDRRGRVGVGWSNTDVDFNDVGNVGGAKTHTLTTPELAAHTHSTLAKFRTATVTANAPYHELGENTANTTAGTATGAAGSGVAHNNLQPYLVLVCIIKV